MNTEVVYGHITRTSGISGGRPASGGIGSRVQDIAIGHEWQAMSPEEICHQHPGLTLAEVFAALAYYYDHRDEILADIEADRASVEQFRLQYPDSTASPGSIGAMCDDAELLEQVTQDIMERPHTGR